MMTRRTLSVSSAIIHLLTVHILVFDKQAELVNRLRDLGRTFWAPFAYFARK